MMNRGLINRYRAYLPVTDKTPIVTLDEGNTPLIYAHALSTHLGAKVYLKFEGSNPTGSFKDRGMTMAISKAAEEGAKAVICASTGNTSASAAAYAARAGIPCVVLIPNGQIALGKLSQALIHGAKVLAIDGNFDVALEMVRELSSKHGFTLVNSLNPYRIEGQKTGAFEICDALGDAPDFHAIPVGNAGNITAYWKGYNEYFKQKKIKSKPVMIGFQAEGSAPIVKGRIIENPKTLATAIKIGNPASWKQAEAARDESGGLIDSVTDEEILEAYRWLAQREGVFAEPASAASVAGCLKLAKTDFFKKAKDRLKHEPVVTCVLTGHGLKDPDCVLKNIKQPSMIPATLEAILEAIRS